MSCIVDRLWIIIFYGWASECPRITAWFNWQDDYLSPPCNIRPFV